MEEPVKTVGYAGGVDGVERFDLTLGGRYAYAPHRHDTYAVGVTAAGVQTFDYRGATRQSRQGEAYILHPDERHDGRSGLGGAFAYRTLYIAPHLIGQCLEGGRLPFVADPVQGGGPVVRAALDALAAFEAPPDELHLTEVLAALAEALAAASDAPPPPPRSALDVRAVARVRSLLRESLHRNVGIAELEAESGLDRWTLYRQFRAVQGVSPHRFLQMRRLDAARRLIGEGTGLAEAAAAAGFADQSHMTRRFRDAYGLSPGGWRSLLAASPDV